MKINTTLSLVLVIALSLFSCNKNKEPKPDDSGRFLKFFGTAGMSQAYAIAEVGDGFVLAGYSILDMRTDKDIYIIKTDKNGNKLWEQRIETSKDEIARDLRVESNGDIVITGMQVQPDNYAQAVLFTLNSGGTVLEKRYFGKSLVHEDAYHISKLTGGDYLIGGVRDSAGNRNMYLTRIAPDSIVWEFNLGPLTQQDDLNRIVELSNGNLLWSGTAERTEGKNIRCILSSPDGNIHWSYEYDLNTTSEYGRDITPTSDGSFIIVGSRGTENSDAESLLLMKISSNGEKIWETQPVSGSSGGYSVKPVSSGGYIVSGYQKIETGNTDLLLLRINEDGATTWEKTFGGSRLDQGRMAFETSDGYFAMVGYADLFLNVNNVFCFIKTDSEGNLNETKE